MTTVSEVQGIITEVSSVTQTAAQLVEGLDPAVAIPTATAASLVTIITQLISVGLQALTMAQGEAINPTTIASLDPDPTALTPPTP